MKTSPTLLAYLGMSMSTSPEMDSLIAAVDAKDTIDGGVVTFLNGLGPMIAAVAGDKAATLALAQKVTDRGTQEAAALALVNNTPAAP